MEIATSIYACVHLFLSQGMFTRGDRYLRPNIGFRLMIYEKYVVLTSFHDAININ